MFDRLKQSWTVRYEYLMQTLEKINYGQKIINDGNILFSTQINIYINIQASIELGSTT